MNFEDAMHAVEEARSFPAPGHLHARRLAWILERSGLHRRAAALPWALVAGSCGKASTARFLAFIVRRLLDRAGVDAPVVLGTKPPLSETHDGQRERYQLFARAASAPHWIDRADFARLVDALLPVAEALAREAPELGPVAPYDLRYAVLLAYAVDRGAAFAVVEANIGLRDDPTSALPPPRAQLLTPIDADHAQLLRPPAPLPAALEGLGERAGPVWHKAGGLRPGVPVVVGVQEASVARAVAALAAERGTGGVVWRGADYDVLRRVCALDGPSARRCEGGGGKGRRRRRPRHHPVQTRQSKHARALGRPPRPRDSSCAKERCQATPRRGARPWSRASATRRCPGAWRSSRRGRSRCSRWARAP